MTYFDTVLFTWVLNKAVELEYYGGFLQDLDCLVGQTLTQLPIDIS